MPHPQIDIDADTAFELVPMHDEQGRSIVVAVIKATVGFDAGGRLSRCEPAPVCLSPEYYGEPGQSSLKVEADTAFGKEATDVVLLGHARSHGGPVQSLDVGLRVGPVQKIARVYGDRKWVRDGGTVMLTRPVPFESMPLVYERAFGGWDRSHEDARRHTFEPRNPVGTGFGTPLRNSGDAMPAPNIVDTRRSNLGYGDAAEPVGFGCVAPHWAPRAALAGTFDEAWNASRKPLLPEDFRRRHFNAASQGLTSPTFLRGDEPLTLVNVGAAPRIDFRLPAEGPAACTFVLRGGRELATVADLDTVVIDGDAGTVNLVWRTSVPARDGIHDVVAVKARVKLSPLPPADPAS